MSKWRVGRKVGRTIYQQLGDEPSDDDELIGVMDTPLLADMAVVAVNKVMRDRRLARERDEYAAKYTPTRYLP